MGELELVGLHDDGEHLVLIASDGQRFRLRIDEALRAAVRRDRPHLEQIRATASGTLSPRDIQTRVRAGMTAEQISEVTGAAVDHIRRYEGPVLAEREFVVDQARATQVGHSDDAPTLGDLVTDRLATRGVAAGSLTWDSSRQPGAPWIVTVNFTIGTAQLSARWTFDTATRAMHAEDDEARWLSETVLDSGPLDDGPRRHLASVPVSGDAASAVRPVLTAIDAAVAAPVDPTEALLDDLRSRRGIRQQLDPADDSEPFEGFGPQQAFDQHGVPALPPGAIDPATERPVVIDPTRGASASTPVRGIPLRSADVEPSAGRDASHPATEQIDAHDQQPDAERARSRRSRSKVPSWDEIVFGAKPE